MKKHFLFYLLTFAFLIAFLPLNAEEATLTNANINEAGPASENYKAWEITDDNGAVWDAIALKGYYNTASASTQFLQIKKYSRNIAYYIHVPEYGTKITSITMTVSNANRSITGGGNTKTLFFSSSKTTSEEGEGVASGTGDASVTIDCTDLNVNTGYITANGEVRIWEITVTYEDENAWKADPELAFSETSVIGYFDVPFTPPTLNTADGFDGTVTYASSNSNIQVDANTGEVTLDKSLFEETLYGVSTTITAKSEVTDNFKAGEASYELMVFDPRMIATRLCNVNFGPEYYEYLYPADFTSASYSIAGITITYGIGTGQKAYIGSGAIILDEGNTLTFTAPPGFALKQIIFDALIINCISSCGMYNSGNAWDAPEDEVVTEVCFTGTPYDLEMAAITIVLEPITSVGPQMEVVSMDTDGYVTYVVKNDIDWALTLAKNTADGTVNVHGYKVVQFTKNTAAFVEFGVGGNETVIPAETPIILKGTKGNNELVVANSGEPIAEPVNNLLKPSYGDVTAAEGQHLLVFQKKSNWSENDPYNNYAFFKLKDGRTIPERKAYLDGTDVSEEVTYTTNTSEGVFLLEDLGNEQTTSDIDMPSESMQVPIGRIVYDLTGRKVADVFSENATLPKGIYIVGGHKMVVK